MSIYAMVVILCIQHLLFTNKISAEKPRVEMAAVPQQSLAVDEEFGDDNDQVDEGEDEETDVDPLVEAELVEDDGADDVAGHADDQQERHQADDHRSDSNVGLYP